MRRFLVSMIVCVLVLSACEKPDYRLTQVVILEFPTFCSDDLADDPFPEMYFSLFDVRNNLYFSSDTLPNVTIVPRTINIDPPIKVYEQYYDMSFFDFDPFGLNDFVGGIIFNDQMRSGTYESSYNEICPYDSTWAHVGNIKVKLVVEKF